MVEVKLYIKEDLYEDYLRWVFTHKKAGGRKVSTNHIIINPKFSLGKTIISLAKISGRPKISHGDPVKHLSIQLPLANYRKENHFHYFDEFATQQINYAIDSLFDIDFRNFCASGREKGIKTHLVIQAFMRMYNIRNTPDLFERLKKRDYRYRKILDEYLVQGIKSLDPSVQIIDNQE